MAFSDDHGGFAFACADAKMSLRASTWSTALSQIGRLDGHIYIMTGLLPDTEYISQIIGKRPRDIFIIANTLAQANAELLKHSFPNIRIVLHPKNNAKIALISPKTVWVSSADFGKSEQIESAVGMHSEILYSKTLDSIFNKTWVESQEVN